MIPYCPFECKSCNSECHYWIFDKCEIMDRCEFIIIKQFIDDLVKWREDEYKRMKIPEFAWMRESKANLIWYHETLHLKKLRGDKE
jgi:hypothetical protein